jgi:hypothetical protein
MNLLKFRGIRKKSSIFWDKHGVQKMFQRNEAGSKHSQKIQFFIITAVRTSKPYMGTMFKLKYVDLWIDTN